MKTEKHSLWKKDFSLMVAGQVVSLFGNAVLRFALSLYVLDETGSAAAFGSMMAVSLITTLLLSPGGGLLSDRVSRQRLMVLLDFSTSMLLLGFLLGMWAFQVRGALARLPLARVAMWGLLAVFAVAGAFHVPRTALLFLVYAVGLAGVAADARGVQGGVSQALAPWAQLSFSLYLLHPLALKIALNWVGFGAWGLTGDAMRLWCLLWVILLFPIAYASLVLFERPARDRLATWGKH